VSNPTGTVYLAANTGYTWIDGDVYEIPQTDQLEGAATGASFSGLGVVNQPHQLLLNKIQLTHTKQVADEVNIAALQAFENLFTSTVGTNGFLKLGTEDSNLGQIAVIVQWGTISLLGVAPSSLRNGLFTFNFPTAFPHAIWMLLPYFQSNNIVGELALSGAGGLQLEAITPLGLAQNKLATDQTINANQTTVPPITINVATTPTDGNGLTGIGWLAIGY
jgi:hypothetical protein